MNVAVDYPAKEQPDGRVWFKAAVRSAGETWGWTADPAQAHPDYQVKIGDDGSAVTWVGDPWGGEDTVILPLVPDADLPNITINGQRVDWPGDCPDCYRTGEQRKGCNCLLPEPLISTTTVTLSDPIVKVTTTTQEDDMPAKTKAAPVITEGGDDDSTVTPDQFDAPDDAPRFTEWMRYPLPPAPPRAKVSYDGYGRYKLPSPSTGRPTGFSRATTIAKTLEETYNLSRWSRRQAVKAIIAAVGAADADEDGTDVFDTAGSDRTPVGVLGDVMAAIVAEDDRALDAAVDLLDNLTGGADARELGEAVHAWLEAVDIGTVLPWQVPTMFQPYVAAARDALRRAGLVAVAEYVERIVLNDRGDETVVGTIDRIYRVVTTGELIMGDVKTSKTLDYSWLPYSVQVGGVYGYATKMFRADADVSQGQHGWEPMPEIGQKFAVILHVPSDQPERSAVVTIDMYFGGESMVASLDARKRRKESTKKVPFVHEIPVPSKAALRYVEARDAVLDTTDAKDLALTWESYQDVWTDDLTELGNHVVQLLDAAASATA